MSVTYQISKISLTNNDGHQFIIEGCYPYPSVIAKLQSKYPKWQRIDIIAVHKSIFTNNHYMSSIVKVR